MSLVQTERRAAVGLRRLVYDGADYREGIRAFKEKRPPRFVGA